MSHKINYNDIVIVVSGRHRGRIAIVDNEEMGKAIIYFGSMFTTYEEYEIKPKYLRLANVKDLIGRQQEILADISPYNDHPISSHIRCNLLAELILIIDELAAGLRPNEYWFRRKGRKSSVNVFLSHSSLDRQFARTLRVDLLTRGFNVWIDEQEINVGESILKKISDAIEASHFVLVLLSKSAVKSKWVEKEWTAKLSHEISTGKVSVIPVLLERCHIPGILCDKKYADFSRHYEEGLQDLTKALSKLTNAPIRTRRVDSPEAGKASP